MAVGYLIQADLNLLYFLGVGACTGADYRKVNLQAAADPARRPGMHTIIDMLPVTDLDVRLDELKAIIASDRQLVRAGVYGEAFKTAVLARSEVDEVLGALYNAYVREEHLGIRLFGELEDALEWLGLVGNGPDVEQLRGALLKRLLP